ncbi:MAG: crossover junction endodeoxyribonuclease RuvC [Terrimicrobiaceae bacterium]|nr:crossover junction endodeoxyribonuclease RuvC [Terrimicrobiaceae bacterium]
MVVLAVDPSLRGTGYGVLCSEDGRVAALDYGVIAIPASKSLAECLRAIHDRISTLAELHQPSVLAMESIIFVQSHRTAIALGAACGAVLLAASQKELPVHEYAPRRVKQAVVGRGAAHKGQVAFMVRAMLGLSETPLPDAADALAVGLTHLQACKRI